jgi:hypothetical protein
MPEPLLTTLETYYGSKPPLPGLSRTESYWIRYGGPKPFVQERPTRASRHKPVRAFVDNGIWVVRCPECDTQHFAPWADRRFHCLNENGCPRAASDQWDPVEWPEDWEKIEWTLMYRPRMHNWNYLPGETLEDLERENFEHGVGPKARQSHVAPRQRPSSAPVASLATDDEPRGVDIPVDVPIQRRNKDGTAGRGTTIVHTTRRGP